METDIGLWYVFPSQTGNFMVVRIDPISSEIEKDTQYILDHLKWASQLGPQRETYIGFLIITKIISTTKNITVIYQNSLYTLFFHRSIHWSYYYLD